MFLGVQSYQTSVWVFELLMVQKSGQPVEVGSLSHYLQGFQQHPRLFRISEPSTGCLGTSGIILGFCIPPQRFFFASPVTSPCEFQEFQAHLSIPANASVEVPSKTGGFARFFHEKIVKQNTWHFFRGRQTLGTFGTS